jgi:hypothetical protein
MALMLLDNNPNSGGFGLSGISGRFSSSPPSPGVVTSVVTSGLVLHLDAGNIASYPGSGTTWSDLSGNGNHVTLVNGPTFDPTFNNGSIVFDGVNDYAETFSGNGLSQFTIGLWVRTTSAASSPNYWSQPCFFGKETGGVGTGDLGITINSGQLGYFSGMASGIDQASNWTIINDGAWKHIVLTSDGTNTRLYLNGQFVNGSLFNVNRSLNSDPFRIGSGFQGTPVNTSIASVVFYNRSLSQEEITQNYNAGWGGSAAPTITPTTAMVLHLDAGNASSYPGSGTTWLDLSGRGNNATLVNGTSFSNGAMIFDGVNDYVNVTENLRMTPPQFTFNIKFQVDSHVNTATGGSPDTVQYIAFRQNTNSGDFEGYVVTYDENTRKVTFGGRIPFGSTAYATSTTQLTLGQVYQVTGVATADSVKLFINGQLEATTAKNFNISYNANHTLKLGRTIPVGNENGWGAALNGKIYSVKMYDVAFSDSVITDLYNAQ